MKIIAHFLVITLLFSVLLMPLVPADGLCELLDNKLWNNAVVGKRNRGPIMDGLSTFLKRIPFINRTINSLKNFFGLMEDSTNDLGETISYAPYAQFEENDPQSSNPTDTSISVTIEDFDITYTTTDHTFEFDMSFNGKTTGDVSVCYWILVTYFNDGTNSYYNLWNGPSTQQEIELYDTTMGATFFGNGPGGYNDWSSFQGRQYTTGPTDDQEELPFEVEEITPEKYAVDVLLYVRAFSDTELTQWNQDSISLFDDVSGNIYTKPQEHPDEDDKDIPGFEMIFVLMAVAMFLVIKRKHKG